MALTAVLINVTDIGRSVDFYTTHLGALPLEVGSDSAELDVVTARIRLERLDTAAETTWIPDDLQRGFRHLGFKTADLDGRVAALKRDGARFHLDPLSAEGGVRIAFFYDPDGTLVELVEGPLQYHEVFDRDAVDSDWALGEPDRPRFDHIAESVADAEATHAHYQARGFVLMGGIHQPHDNRGFEITFLRDGDVSIEVFSFDAPMIARAPQLDAPGFRAAELTAPFTGTEPVMELAGRAYVTDMDGLVQTEKEA